jgi:hypothetical protein
MTDFLTDLLTDLLILLYTTKLIIIRLILFDANNIFNKKDFNFFSKSGQNLVFVKN